MEDIQRLMEELKATEQDRIDALRHLESVISDAVEDILDLLYKLYGSLMQEKLTIKSYTGESYPVDDGIVIYERGIEEKIILNKEKKLVHFKLIKGEPVRTEISAFVLINQIGSEKIYNSLSHMLNQRIKKNKKDILTYRSQASKIAKYTKETTQ